jgi:xanthosine phosphorylase
MSAADTLAERAPGFAPRLAILLGSGLGGVADALEDRVEVPYEELDGFPRPSVAGHGGRIALGRLHGLPVACLQGRAHVYEGGDPGAMRGPVRTLRELGAEALLVTNAAGSLRADVGPGRLMALTDHINMLGVNPLVGPNDDAVGPRFLSLRDAYDPRLLELLRAAALALGIELAEGVYLATSGPSFETPAEIRAFRTLGADAVGMSTVPETVAGAALRMRVLGLSCITNVAGSHGSHEDVLRAGREAAEGLRRVLAGVVPTIAG